MKSNTLNKKIFVVSLALTSLGMSGSTKAADWQFHASGVAANKSSDDDGWQAQDIDGLILRQDSSLGGMFDMQRSSWPVALAVDFFVSGDNRKSSGFEETAITIETHIGARKYWGTAKQRWQSYVGGGITLIGTELESELGSTKVSDDDTDTGFWLGGGANWYVSEQWYVGLDVRYSTGTLNVFEQERDVDGVMAGLTVGLTW